LPSQIARADLAGLTDPIGLGPILDRRAYDIDDGRARTPSPEAELEEDDDGRGNPLLRDVKLRATGRQSGGEAPAEVQKLGVPARDGALEGGLFRSDGRGQAALLKAQDGVVPGRDPVTGDDREDPGRVTTARAGRPGFGPDGPRRALRGSGCPGG